MRMDDLNKLFATLLLLCVFASGNAQGWERTFGNSNKETANDLIQLADGSYIVVGTESTTDFYTNYSNISLLRTDPDGRKEWSQTFGEPNQDETGESVQQDASGGYIIGGTQINDNINRGLLIRTDRLGNLIWKYQTSTDSVQGRAAIALQDGGYLLVGNYLKSALANGVDQVDKQVYLTKVNQAGIFQWENILGSDLYDDGFSVIELPNGELVVAGSTHRNENYDVLLLKFHPNGTLKWEKVYGGDKKELAYDLALSKDKTQLFITGSEHISSTTMDDIFLLKTDLEGGEEDWISIAKPGRQIGFSIAAMPDNFAVIAGRNYSETTEDQQLLFTVVSESGQTFSKTFGGEEKDFGSAVIFNNSKSYTIAGATHSYGSGDSDMYLVQSDGSDISIANTITGSIDVSSGDCASETIIQGAPNQIIQVKGEEIYYTVTDESGNYSINVPAGNYIVSPVALHPYWQIVCPDTTGTIEVNFTDVFETVDASFNIIPEITCPAMQTDIAVNHLRPGFQSTYTFTYCNNGTVTADAALMDVILDDYLSIDSTSHSYMVDTTDGEEVLFFFLGDVPIFECEEIKIYVTLDSSVEIGQTHCVESHVYPNSLCFPINPEWDQSSIKINASCEYDSVKFKIINEGVGDMQEALDFIVIEDQILDYQGQFTLDSGEDTTIYVTSTGATFRMEAEQSAYHPGNSQPSIAVEGCADGPVNTGHVIEFPQNDGNPFIEIDCRENTSSYDPNDKQAFPRGYSDEHFIEPNTDIEYLIRFQNEGTDTAFTVIIRDTLSSSLNEFSVIPGASSHDYKFELYNSNVLKFTFNDILLPHKDIDEMGSMGFVKFKIKQKDNNPIGTEILNSAAIYFDYNAPVITEPAYHVIGENFVAIDVTSSTGEEFENANATIKVYPNPFINNTTFEIENPTHQAINFSLFDLNSRLVRQDTFSTEVYKFEKNDLTSGLYIFKLDVGGEVIGTGKIVLK